MSLNLHFMHSHFDFSPENMAKGSTRTFPKWKRGTVDNESKYVGLLLLESYNGDINW